MKANLKGKDMSKMRRVEMYVAVDGLHLSCKTNIQSSPETMGAVCAVVYLLTIIIFIPFPFYKDIVAATSGGGNREIVIERHEVENGRVLHRFPHSRVRMCHGHGIVE